MSQKTAVEQLIPKLESGEYNIRKENESYALLIKNSHTWWLGETATAFRAANDARLTEMDRLLYDLRGLKSALHTVAEAIAQEGTVGN